MAKITVHVFANLRAFTGGKPFVEVDIPPGQTIRQVLATLAFPDDSVHIVFVNHRASNLDHALQDNDRVDLFSAIGGG